MKILDLINASISNEKDAGHEYREMIKELVKEDKISDSDKEFMIESIKNIEKQEIMHKTTLKIIRDYLNIVDSLEAKNKENN